MKKQQQKNVYKCALSQMGLFGINCGSKSILPTKLTSILVYLHFANHLLSVRHLVYGPWLLWCDVMALILSLYQHQLDIVKFKGSIVTFNGNRQWSDI
jgi:hypothetical protein